MNDTTLARYAALVTELGANVQPGQDVAIVASTDAARFVRAVVARAYELGARFVDPWYFDPYVKRIRAERAAEESLDYVPPWYGERLKQLAERRGARIAIKPFAPPGLTAGLDPAVAGRDLLPHVPESLEVNQVTNWCVVPWATTDWARVVHPELDPPEALAALVDDLAYVLRLDEPDTAAAWRARFGELDAVARALDAADLDALHFDGPGTDLTIGLLPSSRFTSVAGWTTPEEIVFTANLPSEEVFTTPDPMRADGVVTATKPLDLNGTLVEGLRIRFEGGRVVEIDADRGADALRACVAKDDGAARLGEVALVDRESRIGKTGRTFFNTLLDENAASHIALGRAYARPVGDDEQDRINQSEIHVDFMIGSDEVDVTGLSTSHGAVPVLRRGVWQI